MNNSALLALVVSDKRPLACYATHRLCLLIMDEIEAAHLFSWTPACTNGPML